MDIDKEFEALYRAAFSAKDYECARKILDNYTYHVREAAIASGLKPGQVIPLPSGTKL